MKMKNLVLSALLAASLLGASWTALAQNRWVAVVQDQLLAAAVELGFGANFLPSHDAHYGELWRNQEVWKTLDLDAGIQYAIVGACDQGCRDLDLWLYDSRGHLVAQDRQGNDLPFLLTTPAWDQRYSLKIKMDRCRDQPCYYGIGVFGR